MDKTFFHVSSILMIFFVWGNLFVKINQYSSLKYTRHGGRRLPWFYESDPPHRIFGSAATVGEIVGAVCQLTVVILRMINDFDSWIPNIIMFFSLSTVVFEIIQTLVFELRRCLILSLVISIYWFNS